MASNWGRVDRRSRSRASAESAVVPLPGAAADGRLDLGRLVPTGRSIALALAITIGALGCYLCARYTAVFAVRQITVIGAEGTVAEQVQAVLADHRGSSLLAVDLESSQAELAALPVVASVALDRAFPHTLTVHVRPERAVAVIRRGTHSFLLSARGRVMGEIERGAQRSLPRIWTAAGIELSPGQLVDGDLALAARSVRPVHDKLLPSPVASVIAETGSLSFRLRSGLQLRLGDTADLELKLEVARRLIPLLEPGTTYLDVSLPARSVAGSDT